MGTAERDPTYVIATPSLGPECLWILKPKEYRQIFITGYLTLNSPIAHSAFVTAVETAWTTLRLEVPDVAIRPAIVDTTTYLQYEPPKDETEVETWLRRTAFFDYGTEILGLKDLREKIISSKAGQDSDSTFLLAYSENDANKSPVTRCQILLNVDHRITDGIGARIIFGKYLSLLALSLVAPHKQAWDEDVWRQSARNLSIPWISMINSEQVICGPEYQNLVAENQSNLDKLVSPGPESLRLRTRRYWTLKDPN